MLDQILVIHIRVVVCQQEDNLQLLMMSQFKDF